ncbi:DnaA/Hda family protein [Limoniibacter endophyticus]|uniref:Regulatory inactivation of DnaA Hda protein n=1 Tax=Limoniibacter endophyticus TaxID=1565040 RepID=A0A8J3DHX2_9HYPH|nr:DnaA/Hda family protein [Limoniibacter endophyticus]GHC68649.1 hypothetical protein GCM10010136_13560 [Limoniibacter endophyticus]
MTNTPPPRQLPLTLAHEPALTRDDLIVAPANAAAVALIDRYPEWPASVVVLNGPAGAGKSHIGAIWLSEQGAVKGDITSIDEALLEAARTHPILLDNADAGRIDETGLFHLINEVKAHGSHLLLLGAAGPENWAIGLPDLRSRLRAAAQVEIEAPDDSLLTGVIFKLFADRQIEIDPQLAQFIVRRIERSLDVARLVVERMDQLALEQKSRITRSIATQAIETL